MPVKSKVQELIVLLPLGSDNETPATVGMAGAARTARELRKLFHIFTDDDRIQSVAHENPYLFGMMGEISGLIQRLPTTVDLPGSKAENVLRAIKAIIENAGIEAAPIKKKG